MEPNSELAAAVAHGQAADREIARLRGALMAIRDRHMGDCPASMEEVQHAANHIRDIRSIATTALKE